ncbi:MAG: hypothetical protein ACK5NK_04465 [Niabella sp.]
MSNSYKILFVIELRHDYFNSKVPDFLEVVPTDATNQQIKNLGLICKTGLGYCAVLAIADNDNKPVRAFSNSTVFNFLLKPLSHHFANTTNISTPDNKKMFFSNTAANNVGNQLYISTPIPFYTNTATYNIGSFAKSATGQIYEALRPSDSGSPQPLTNILFWREKGEIPYVTGTDSIGVAGDFYRLPVIPDTNFNLEIFRYNAATAVYSEVAVETKLLTFQDNQSSLMVNLTGLESGIYRINVNGTDSYVFKDESALANDVTGVVQIVNYPVSDANYRLADNTGVMNEPAFVIHFANKSAIWRYRTRTANVTTITDTNVEVANRHSFSLVAPNTFTSDLPVPITQKPIDTLQLHSNVFGDVNYLANPPTSPLHLVEQHGHTYYCVEQYIQY